MEAKTFINSHVEEISSHSFFGGDLFQYSQVCPGYDINQDSSGFLEVPGKLGLLVIADGMGGHEKGELASKTVVTGLMSQMKKFHESKPYSEIILDSIEKSHQKIKESPEMGGTTLTVCEMTKNYVRFYNIGDSFALVMTPKGGFRFRTIDDSITGYGVESGLITEEKALVHAESNVITNALGMDDYRIEVSCKIQISKGDLILLSSDGLSANLTTEVITGTITSGHSDNRLEGVVHLAREQMVDEKAKIRNPDDLTCFLYVSK